MTRKEEIVQAANNYKNQFPDGFINEHVYVDGAEWADKTMIEKACKYISMHQCEYIDLDDFKDYMKGE